MVWLKQRWMFCSQRLLDTETKDIISLYCANPCLLGVSCGSSLRLPHTGVLGAGCRCFPSFKGSFVPTAGWEQSLCSLWAGTWRCPWMPLCCPAGGSSHPCAGRCWWLQPGLVVRLVPVPCLMLCVPMSREQWQGCPLGCSHWRVLEASEDWEPSWGWQGVSNEATS